MVRLSEDPKYGFAIGRVRALESALMDRPRYERFVRARSGEEFVAALAETAYGRFIENGVAGVTQAFAFAVGFGQAVPSLVVNGFWPPPVAARRRRQRPFAQAEEEVSASQLEACRQHGEVVSLQPPFNLFEREAEREILPYCQQNGIATLVYGGLCRGMLTGKFTGDEPFPRGDLRRGDPKFKPDRFKQYVKAVNDLKKIAASYGKTMAQFALRWALQQPGVTTVIAGARTAAQVEDNAGVSGGRISAEDLAKVDAIVDKHVKTPVGPEFMAPRP